MSQQGCLQLGLLSRADSLREADVEAHIQIACLSGVLWHGHAHAGQLHLALWADRASDCNLRITENFTKMCAGSSLSIYFQDLQPLSVGYKMLTSCRCPSFWDQDCTDNACRAYKPARRLTGTGSQKTGDSLVTVRRECRTEKCRCCLSCLCVSHSINCSTPPSSRHQGEGLPHTRRSALAPGAPPRGSAGRCPCAQTAGAAPP